MLWSASAFSQVEHLEFARWSRQVAPLVGTYEGVDENGNHTIAIVYRYGSTLRLSYILPSGNLLMPINIPLHRLGSEPEHSQFRQGWSKGHETVFPTVLSQNEIQFHTEHLLMGKKTVERQHLRLEGEVLFVEHTRRVYRRAGWLQGDWKLDETSFLGIRNRLDFTFSLGRVSPTPMPYEELKKLAEKQKQDLSQRQEPRGQVIPFSKNSSSCAERLR